MIILTAAEANIIKGLSCPGHMLVPAPLTNGTFALPVEVLDDPCHEAKHDFLMNKPTREVEPNEWVWDVDPESENGAP